VSLDPLDTVGECVDTEVTLLRRATEQLTIALSYDPSPERITEAMVSAMMVGQRADRLVEVLNGLLEKPDQ
jgi:hypothetical protein